MPTNAVITFCLLTFLLHTSALASKPPAPVFTQRVEIKPYTESIEALGMLRANEAVTLSASVTEIITAVNFEDGQNVSAGEVLVEMTSREERALLKQAKSELEDAKRQYERVKALESSKLATESSLDQLLAQLESAKAKYSATQSRLEDRLIIAPFNGIVGLRNVSVGTLVRPGDTITTLDDNSLMKLDINVPAVFLTSVKPGLKVKAKTRDLGHQPFEGEVVSIDSRIDPITRSIIVRARFQNQNQQLKPGMLMTVALEKPEQKSIIIPEVALVQEGFNQYVFVIKDQPSADNTVKIVEKRKITTGFRLSGEITVESGLNEGEQIVTHGIMRLSNNTEVKIVSPKESLKQTKLSNSKHSHTQ